MNEDWYDSTYLDRNYCSGRLVKMTNCGEHWSTMVCRKCWDGMCYSCYDKNCTCPLENHDLEKSSGVPVDEE